MNRDPTGRRSVRGCGASSGLARKARLHKDLMAAHVDDRVDVLDVDGALFDAHATGRAGPEHVGLDHPRDERGIRRRATVCMCACPPSATARRAGP